MQIKADSNTIEVDASDAEAQRTFDLALRNGKLLISTYFKDAKWKVDDEDAQFELDYPDTIEFIAALQAWIEQL